MADQKTKFTVGLFLAGGICIALLAVIWLGMSRFLEKGHNYVTYFNESVQGLDIDSPVKYRGVSVGRVESIKVAPDSKLIQVVLKIESGQTLENDILAQLKAVGITGSMFIELDRKKKGEPDRSPTLSFPSEYPIVASKPSNISELLQGIDDVLKQIRSLDLGGISGKAKLALDNMSQMIADANVKGLSSELGSSLKSVSRILNNQRWDNIVVSVEEASKTLNTLTDNANKSLLRVDDTIGRIQQMVAEKEKTIKTALEDFSLAMKNANILLEKGSSIITNTDDSLSHLKGHLLVVARNLERASENLNRLIDLIADQPSQLIFGEPPAPRKTEPVVHEK